MNGNKATILYKKHVCVYKIWFLVQLYIYSAETLGLAEQQSNTSVMSVMMQWWRRHFGGCCGWQRIHFSFIQTPDGWFNVPRQGPNRPEVASAKSHSLIREAWRGEEVGRRVRTTTTTTNWWTWKSGWVIRPDVHQLLFPLLTSATFPPQVFILSLLSQTFPTPTPLATPPPSLSLALYKSPQLTQ